MFESNQATPFYQWSVPDFSSVFIHGFHGSKGWRGAVAPGPSSIHELGRTSPLIFLGETRGREGSVLIKCPLLYQN